MKVLNREATAQPLALIVGLYAEDLVLEGTVIEVFLVGDDFLGIQLDKRLRIGIEEGAIGLEVNRATRAEHLEVAEDEARRGQALGHLLHLRVGEGDPDLIHFARSEEARQGLDLPTQEGYIRHPSFVRSLSSRPDTRPLDVYSDEVLLGVELTQTYGILPLTTA